MNATEFVIYASSAIVLGIFLLYSVARAAARRQRGAITPELVTLFLLGVLPVLIMSFFVYGDGNYDSVGSWLNSYDDAIPIAYGLSVLGLFVLVVAGFYGYRLPGLTRRPCELVAASLQDYWLRRTPILVGAAIGNGLLLLLMLKFQTIFTLRTAVEEEPQFRPVLTAAVALASSMTSFALMRIVVLGARGNLALLAFAMSGLLCASLRGPLIYPVINAWCVVLATCPRQDSFRYLARTLALGVGVLLLGLVAGALRSEREMGELLSTVNSKVLYGSNFSELRDFAWIISLFDGDLLWGRSYASGMCSMLPSAFAPWREDWSWGEFSIAGIGFSSAEHKGLRGTFVCEPYFNFGIVGVFIVSSLLGLLLGSLTRNTDEAGRLDVTRHRLRIAAALCLWDIAMPFACKTPTITGAYILIALLAIPHLARLRWTAAPRRLRVA